MAVSLALSAELFRDLLAHLYSSDEEEVAFLFSAPPYPAEQLSIIEMYPVPAQGYTRHSPYHVALTDRVRADVITRATELGACLVEVHSHEDGPPACFSPTDLSGFEEWVPHVRWRLGGRTYVALVFAAESFDALVWKQGTAASGPLAGIAVEGETPLIPTGITHAAMVGPNRGN